MLAGRARRLGTTLWERSRNSGIEGQGESPARGCCQAQDIGAVNKDSLRREPPDKECWHATICE
jgi:hypothetical protein